MKNKKSLSIAAVALLMGAAASFAQTSGKLTIKGNLTDVKDTLVIASVELGEQSITKLADLVTDGGKFEYSINLDKPKTLILYRPFTQQQGQMMMQTLSIPAIPDENVEVSGTVMQATVKGTGFYQDYAPINDIIMSFNKAMLNATESYSAAAKDSLKREKAGEAYQKTMEEAGKKMMDQIFDYARKNPDKETTALLASSIQTEYLDDYLKLLSPKAKEGRMKPAIDAALNRMEAEKKQKEAEKSVAEGKMAPDFTLNDLNGKPFTLSSLRGKYVILDFWGSWCGWCIKGMPDMKKYYEKYRGKFEIVGIDCNDSEQKWKKAVADNELSWINVKNETKDATPQRYAVKGYPTKVVVAPDGKIAKIVVGEDPAFYTYLDELFGK